MWLVPPLISEPTSREMRLIKNTPALTNLSFHPRRRPNKKLDPLRSRLKIWDLFDSRGNRNANERNKAGCEMQSYASRNLLDFSTKMSPSDDLDLNQC
jgi:hypothetical protein